MVNSLGSQGYGSHFQVWVNCKSLIPEFVFEPLEISKRLNFDNYSNNKKKHAILIEDNLHEQTLLKIYFHSMGFEFQTAYDIYDGFDIYKKSDVEFSVIAVDVAQDEEKIIKYCSLLREYERNFTKKNIPLFLISSNKELCEEQDFKSLKEIYFLIKPINYKECNMIVSNAVSKFKGNSI